MPFERNCGTCRTARETDNKNDVLCTCKKSPNYDHDMPITSRCEFYEED